MIKQLLRLSLLALALIVNSQIHVNAMDKETLELGDSAKTSSSSNPKKRKLEEKAKPENKKDTLPEVSINLCPIFREDVVVELNLSYNKYLTDINFLLVFPNLTSLDIRDCLNLKDNYYPVSGLKKLRTLDMRGIGLITTTQHLSPLINLTSLKIFTFE